MDGEEINGASVAEEMVQKMDSFIITSVWPSSQR